MGTGEYQLRLMISQGDFGENAWATTIAMITNNWNKTDLIAHKKKFQFMFYARIDLRTNNSKSLYLHAIPQVEINCGVELNPPCKRDLAVANKK